MEHWSEFFFLILFQGIFQIYSKEISSYVISGFENQQACIEVTEIAEMKTITAYKNDLPMLSWGKNKVILADGYRSRINILNEKNKLEFCFMNISREDAGEYIWKDNDGKIHSILILNVWYGPTDVLFTPNMSESETFNERSSLAINCSAVCNPNCNFYWVKNKDIRISNSSILIFGNLSKMDGGNYTCKATNVKNNNQHISIGLEIHVNYAANINMPLFGYKEVSEYSSVNITCNVSSYPLSNISWYNENKEVNSIFRGKNKVVLNLINSTCDDSGMYKCSAYNGIGLTDSKNITVEVLCKPRFVGSYARHKIKKMVSASIGDEFNMKFTIKAHPRPYLLFNSSDIDINVATVSGFMYEVMMRKTILSDSDFQEYLYIFGNNQGNVTIAIEVKKKTTAFGLIIGVAVSILTLLSIFILLFTVFRRVTHQKVNQAASSNSPNNVDAGGYRDNILYQSVDSVSFLDQIFDFDNAAANFEDSSSSSINQSTNRCFEEDRMKNQRTNNCTEQNKYEGEEDHLNVKLDKNIKTKDTRDTIKGRKPMPRPRTFKTHQEFSKQVPQSNKQKTSNFGNRTFPDMFPKCDVFGPKMTKTQSVDLECCLEHSKYALQATQQFSTGAAVKKTGIKSEVELGQVPKLHKLRMDRTELSKDHSEVCEVLEQSSLYTEQSDFALEQLCENRAIPNDDDPYQYHDYMNI